MMAQRPFQGGNGWKWRTVRKGLGCITPSSFVGDSLECRHGSDGKD